MFEQLRARLGRTVAPFPFVLFGAVFAVVASFAAWRLSDPRFALLIGFDAAALAFFAAAAPILDDEPSKMRRTAEQNDANRVVLLVITVLISLVILFAVAAVVAERGALGAAGVALVVGTLALTWAFANAVFALHYAHIYYLQSDGADQAGLETPRTPHPGYWDFLYFSFTIGMTFQTSDVTITSLHMRKVALAHAMAAFVFNIGVLAFTVNALGGL